MKRSIGPGDDKGDMSRGPKPQPTVMKLLRGNPGKRGINHDEPIPDDLDPATPEELESDEEKREWERAIVPAIKRGQITAAERAMAIAHCAIYAQWRKQLALANSNPEVVGVGPNKHPTPNPARGMSNKSLLLLARIDSELGLTPSSRSRVKVDKSKAGRALSPVELFRQRKQRATG